MEPGRLMRILECHSGMPAARSRPCLGGRLEFLAEAVRNWRALSLAHSYLPLPKAMSDEIDSMRDSFDALAKRLVASGVAAEGKLVGCSEEEIRNLEENYHVRLPAAYRMYLSRMGRASGRLFSHDHVEASYPGVLKLTENYRESHLTPAREGRVILPDNAVIILDRLGDQHVFVPCDGRSDPPVYYFADWDQAYCESHTSVLAWLETWLAEALDAIQAGYYDDRRT